MESTSLSTYRKQVKNWPLVQRSGALEVIADAEKALREHPLLRNQIILDLEFSLAEFEKEINNHGNE